MPLPCICPWECMDYRRVDPRHDVVGIGLAFGVKPCSKFLVALQAPHAHPPAEKNPPPKPPQIAEHSRGGHRGFHSAQVALFERAMRSAQSHVGIPERYNGARHNPRLIWVDFEILRRTTEKV